MFDSKYLRAMPLAFCTALFVSCAAIPSVLKEGATAPFERTEADSASTAAAKTDSVVLCAAGDNLIHIEIINEAKTKDGGFDFSPLYTGIEPLIKGADIAFINMETLCAGEEFGLSGYPYFNAPAELGEAVLRAGFNVVNQATNHSLDKGEQALRKMIAYWKEKNTACLGVFADEQSRAHPVLITKK